MTNKRNLAVAVGVTTIIGITLLTRKKAKGEQEGPEEGPGEAPNGEAPNGEAPTEIELSNLSIMHKEIFVGGANHIQVTATNFGNTGVFAELTFHIDGITKTNRAFLEPGEWEAIGVTVFPREAKTYLVSVGELSGSFVAKFSSPQEPPPEEVPPGEMRNPPKNDIISEEEYIRIDGFSQELARLSHERDVTRYKYELTLWEARQASGGYYVGRPAPTITDPGWIFQIKETWAKKKLAYYKALYQSRLDAGSTSSLDNISAAIVEWEEKVADPNLVTERP